MEAAPPKMPRAPRKKKEKEPEPETRVVPVGDSSTIEGLPTEVLDEIVSLLILIHPRHAFELGLASRFYHFQVRTNPGWKRIAETAGLKPLKASKAVPFSFLTAVSRSWTKICEGCHQSKKDRVPIKYTEDDLPMMLCGPCRVARYVPFRDNFDLNDQPFRLSKTRAKEEFKLSDTDFEDLVYHRGGYDFEDVHAVARKLHGGDRGIQAVIRVARERLEKLRVTRHEKEVERERFRTENRKLRREALLSRLKDLELDNPENNRDFVDFVRGHLLEGAAERRDGQQVYKADNDPLLALTVQRLQQWDIERKERRRTLPLELEKRALEYSDTSLLCLAYIDQNQLFRVVTLETVIDELSESKWFYEHTDYRKIRYPDEEGASVPYVNDLDSRYRVVSMYELEPIPLPTTRVSVYEARLEAMRRIVNKRFAEGNEADVAHSDAQFEDAPAGIIEKVNRLIERKKRFGLFGLFPLGDSDLSTDSDSDSDMSSSLSSSSSSLDSDSGSEDGSDHFYVF